MVRNDLLVAPALIPESKRSTRKLYLPYPDKWFPMNLRPDEDLGAPLLAPVNGGSRVEYDCRLSDQDSQLPYITPMYIREGGIIPKIKVRDYIPDPSLPAQAANPITLHVYPGKDNVSGDSSASEAQLIIGRLTPCTLTTASRETVLLLSAPVSRSAMRKPQTNIAKSTFPR